MYNQNIEEKNTPPKKNFGISKKKLKILEFIILSTQNAEDLDDG